MAHGLSMVASFKDVSTPTCWPSPEAEGTRYRLRQAADDSASPGPSRIRHLSTSRHSSRRATNTVSAGRTQMADRGEDMGALPGPPPAPRWRSGCTVLRQGLLSARAHSLGVRSVARSTAGDPAQCGITGARLRDGLARAGAIAASEPPRATSLASHFLTVRSAIEFFTV